VGGNAGENIEIDYIKVTTQQGVSGAAVYMGAGIGCTPTFTATLTVTPTETSTQVILAATKTYTPTPTATQTATPTATPTPWLQQNEVMAFPQPARGKVSFAYTMAGYGKVSIDIYRITGERIAHIEEHKDGGGGQTLRTQWDALDIAPGIYICRIIIRDAGGNVFFKEMKKIALVK
jgi:hypothetical protein